MVFFKSNFQIFKVLQQFSVVKIDKLHERENKKKNKLNYLLF